MTIFDNINPLGIGTNRLPINGADDIAGVENSARIIAAALDLGASYIDVGYSYSRGFAQAVCKRAFQISKASPLVTIKSSFTIDKTADDALYRTEASLAAMGLDHAAYFVCWNISSLSQFYEIIKKGAIYDGALKAKERGLIDHICFSSHAPVNDIVKIIESGMFEGATIAFSALNSEMMRPVLEAAAKYSVGLAAMNPLGGGVIPQQSEYFSFLKGKDDQNIAQAALRFVKAHDSIQIVLSGFHSMDEVKENFDALNTKGVEDDNERICRCQDGFHALPGYCTGCRYCDGCPAGIPIYAFMQSHNAALFGTTPMYNRTDPKLLKAIQLFRKLYLDFQILPETSKNPCINCGKCEEKCTQNLNITKIISDIYNEADYRGFTALSRKERLDKLLNKSGYKRVGFYPGAGYTAEVMRLYKSHFGEPKFETLYFDSNPKLWGTKAGDITVYSPDDIVRFMPDAIIVSNYIYQDEIMDKLSEYENLGIPVIVLHTKNDVPWVF